MTRNEEVIMDYEASRRFLPNSISFSTPVYHEQNAPLVLTHTRRGNTRSWPLGDLGGSLYSRANMGAEDVVEAGPSRRRIAIACARCRKRKIRCSGDPGNGNGCSSCRQAGVAPMQCQFHRVGSDNVDKVIDNISVAQSLTSMANSNAMMPMYPPHSPVYSRSSPAQQYSQLDTRPMYHNTWSIPYPEDTSPVDTYGLEQSSPYLQNLASMANNTNNNMYGTPCRWTHPIPKPLPNAYFDQEPAYTAHSLPYIQTHFQGSTNDAVSPLNMSSLHLTLPTRPHPRQGHFTEMISPQRQLPMPQPSPAQSSRNVVDRLQDQRLRSVQGIGTSSSNAGSQLSKSFLPWSGGGDDQNKASEATTPDKHTEQTRFVALTSSMDIDPKLAMAVAEPQLELNFTTSTLTEAMNVPVSITPSYSHFRESRPHPSMPTEMAREDSQPSSYSYSTDLTSKRNSFGEESAKKSTLVSGEPYRPLTQSRPQKSPSTGNRRRSSLRSRRVSTNRA